MSRVQGYRSCHVSKVSMRSTGFRCTEIMGTRGSRLGVPGVWRLRIFRDLKITEVIMCLEYPWRPGGYRYSRFQG